MRLFTLIILLLSLTACSSPSEIRDNESTIERVETTPNLVQHHTVQQDDYRLHYVSGGNAQRPSVVFIHGTPGGWGSFATYFEEPDMLKDFQLVSIDRPGWGRSNYPSADFPVHLSEQSRLLGPLLQDIWQNNGQQKVILVGHSLGGSLAPKLAVDYPEYVRAVLILAGDIGPELADARWFNHALDVIPKQWLPEFWYYSNQEVLDLKPELTQLQKQFKSLNMPISVLQGTDDMLVRPANAEFAKRLFSRANIQITQLEDAGHIINLTHVAEVKKAIHELELRSRS